MAKFITPKQAAELIPDGAVIGSAHIFTAQDRVISDVWILKKRRHVVRMPWQRMDF